MSPLYLLILLSAVGAVAFFLAGWLAVPSRGTDPALAKEARLRREAQESQALAQKACDGARAQVDALQRTLNETQARLIAEQQGAEVREAISAAERQRDTARADVQRLTSEAKTLSDRLRAAETNNREAFEREEKTAEAWEQQLQGQRAEQLRQKDLADLELRRLQQALDEQKADGLRLAERDRAFQETQAATARELAQARDERQRCEAEVKALAESLRQAEEGKSLAAVLQAKNEAAWQQKLEAVVAESEARASASQATWAAEQVALRADLQRLTEALSRCKAECDELVAQSRDLETKHRVVSEALAAVESSAATAREAWQEAQVRLRELDQLRQENAMLREEKVHAEASARELATREDDAREARVQLAAAQAKLSDLEQLLEENRKLRDEVADLRLHDEAAGELERLMAEHKSLRLDWRTCGPGSMTWWR